MNQYLQSIIEESKISVNHTACHNGNLKIVKNYSKPWKLRTSNLAPERSQVIQKRWQTFSVSRENTDP